MKLILPKKPPPVACIAGDVPDLAKEPATFKTYVAVVEVVADVANSNVPAL